jgi:hypothetical protein
MLDFCLAEIIQESLSIISGGILMVRWFLGGGGALLVNLINEKPKMYVPAIAS